MNAQSIPRISHLTMSFEDGEVEGLMCAGGGVGRRKTKGREFWRPGNS